MDLHATTTVRRPGSDVYAFWRRLENLPSFMAHVADVRITSDRTTHWTATAPLGQSAEWDAEIVEEVSGERISWRSMGDTFVPNTGEVVFRSGPDEASTEVHL